MTKSSSSVWNRLARFLSLPPAAEARNQPRGRSRLGRLAVEVLEDRWLPSGCQWADSVLGYSSQYSSSSWAAYQATGAPDTFAYGDIVTAWAPSPINGTLEYLALGYAVPVNATGVTIRETYGNGFVYQVDLIDTNDTYHTIWAGTDPSLPGTPVDFHIPFAETSYLVKGVKIYVDTDHDLNAWEEIDAVKLHDDADSSPTAVDDSAVGDEDNPLTIAVLANDSDPDQDPLHVISVSDPANGTVEINADNTIKYLPDPDFVGIDSFSYSMSDGTCGTATASVTVDIHALRAVDDFTSLSEATASVSGNVLTNDLGDSISVFSLSGAGPSATVSGDFGSLVIQSDGSFTYFLNTGDRGVQGLEPGDTLVDLFPYVIQSVRGGRAAATLNITISGLSGPELSDNGDNTAPFGLAAFYYLGTGQTLTVDAVAGVLANVYDAEGDTLSAVLDGSPSHGSLTLNSDGSFSYAPISGFSGQDTFSFRPFDGVQLGLPVLVNLLVAQNPAPVFTIRGTVRYDRSNPAVPNPRPVRQALVEVFDQNNRRLGSGYTDDQGNFSVPLQVRPQFFRIRAYTITRPGAAAGPRHGLAYTTPFGDALRHTMKVETGLLDNRRAPAAATGVSQGLSIGDSTDAEKGFWSFDSFVTAVKLHNAIPNAPFGTMFAWRFPLAVTSYTINERVRLKPIDWDDWDTINHEYGHAVAQSLGFFPFTAAEYVIGQAPMPHSPEENTRITHPNFTREKNNKLAFQEGWANFYSIVAQKVDTTAPVGVGAVGTSRDDKLYTFTVNLGRRQNQTDQQGAVGWSNGEDEELTCMRVLWDLYDSVNTTDTAEDLGMDTIALGFTGVIDKIKPAGGAVAYTLSELWRNLTSAATTAQKVAFGSIFELNNVSAQLQGMEVNGQYSSVWDPVDPLPTFVFDIPGSTQGGVGV